MSDQVTSGRKIIIAAGGALAVLAAAGAVAIHQQRRATADWIGIILAALVCGRLQFLVWSQPTPRPRAWGAFRSTVVLAGCLLAAFAWPAALQPGEMPAATFLFVVPWLWLGAFELQAWTRIDSRQLDKAYWLPLRVVALGLIAVGLLIYFRSVRPFVGDVDFFYYLCYARDITQNVEPISDNRYFYFPGVYSFWCALMRWGLREFSQLQSVVLGLLICNAILVAAIVGRHTKGATWPLFAGLWYLVAATRFQGTTGVTEPLATLPWLIGILIWNGSPLDRRTPWWQVLALGTAIGLTLYVKQQAGLLSLGAAWFVWRLRNSESQPDWRRILALPVVATTVLVLAVVAQGDGLRPLTYGTRAVAAYGTRSGLLTNLYAQFRADPGLAMMAALSFLAVFAPRPYDSAHDRQRNLSGLLMLAAAATLVQFLRRPYHHYMLLALPAIVVSATTLLGTLDRRFAKTVARGSYRLGCTLVCGLLVLAPAGGDRTANPLQVFTGSEKTFPELWHQEPAVAADLAQLKAVLREGQRMYVLPPRHNSVYFLLGTRSAAPLGYTFQFPPPAEIPWERYNTVLILHNEGLDDVDKEKWLPSTAAQAQSALEGLGFRRLRRGSTMDLWVRDS